MTKFWKNEPWANKPEILLESLECFYRKAIGAGKVTTPALTSLKKIMKDPVRGWCSAVPQDRLLAAIEELEIIYIPAGLAPGPAYLFPIKDMTREIKRVHIRMCDDTVYGLRYISIVDKDDFVGPAWLGDSESALAKIHDSGEVLVMEGPFDLLAVRTLAPDLPSICSTTKRLQDQHLDFLRGLGVRRIYAMFDNEASGRGQEAMDVMKATIKDFEIVPVGCNAHDPSDALRNPNKMNVLQRILGGITQDQLTSTLVPTEDF